MIIQADLLVKDQLVTFFTALRADAALVDRLFPTRPLAERTEIKAFFQNNVLPIRLGYPRNVADLPGVFLILGMLGETDRGQTIGEVLSETVTSTTFTEEHGSHFSGVVKCSCMTENGNLTVWLQSLVFAALLLAREDLNTLGIEEQKLSAADFEPMPQWFPSFVFRRDVSLSMTVPITAPKDFLKIADIEVTALPLAASQSVVVTAHQ